MLNRKLHDNPRRSVPLRSLLRCAFLTIFTVIAALVTQLASGVERPTDVLPDDPRDESLLSPGEFFEFEIGTRHLRHDQVVAYFRYLAEQSDRVRLEPYATSHGGRPLLTVAISQPQQLDRLEPIRSQRSRAFSLTPNGSQLSGSTGDAQVEREGPEDQPDEAPDLLVMYMGYSVHGDEASGMNAAPLVAYHLASSNSETVEEWLARGIYLIDPCLNPDGSDRFANWVNENRGRYASPIPQDREHRQPWPGGRTNYYWFDLNRDWLPLVHPESQGRLRLYHRWKPHVVLDYHEMSGNSSYFFQPGVPARNNPLTPAGNLELTRRFAAVHARAMDEAGELFFTEERFDDFYIGKGSTYPDLHGAVGILFEQGSTRGLQMTNDRTRRHFHDTVANQVRTSLSSLRAAAEHRDELIEYQQEFYRSAMRTADQGSISAYLLSGSASRLEVAARMLEAHDIHAYRPKDAIRFAGSDWSRNSILIVPTHQPEYTMLRSLMEVRESFRENIFYDVSTWHLPSAFDLQVTNWEADLPAEWLDELYSSADWHAAGGSQSAGDSQATVANTDSGDASTESTDQPSGLSTAVAGYAFVPLELSSPVLVSRLQQAGAQLRVTSIPITSLDDSAELSIGTFLMLKQPNVELWDELVELLGKSSAELGIEPQTVSSGLTVSGPDLGSDTLLELPTCNPLLLVGDGTNSYSAGALWHFMDVRLEQPTTLVDATDVGSMNLDDYSCVVLPEGSYGDMRDGQVSALQAYVRGGGTLIAVGSAISWLQRRNLVEAGSSDEASENATDSSTQEAERLKFGDADDLRALDSIAGAILLTQIDPTHPLAYGFPDDEVPVFRDHTRRFALPRNPYRTAARYTAVRSGYVNSRNRGRLIDSAAVWAESYGRGRVILLADNPVFRGYMRASERFLTNALFLGPALRIPPPPSSSR